MSNVSPEMARKLDYWQPLMIRVSVVVTVGWVALLVWLTIHVI